jgi:hypothetical protein
MLVEKRLNSLKSASPSGDPDLFITDLKGEMIRRSRRRQNLMTSVSGFVVAIAIGIGLYINNPGPEPMLSSIDMSQAIIDLSGETDSLNVFDDEQFLLASIDYVVERTELFGSAWELVDDLSLYENLETNETIYLEERS